MICLIKIKTTPQMLAILIFITRILTTNIENVLFNEYDVDRALQMPEKMAIDYLLKYFILKRFKNQNSDANLYLLKIPKNNLYGQILVAKKDEIIKTFEISMSARFELLKKISKHVVKAFLKNKSRFNGHSSITEKMYLEEIDHVIKHIWTLDPLILAKFYYYIGSRIIECSSVVCELEFLSSKSDTTAKHLLLSMHLYGPEGKSDLKKIIDFTTAKLLKSTPSFLVEMAKLLLKTNPKMAKKAFKIGKYLSNDQEANYYLFMMNKEKEKKFDGRGYLNSSLMHGFLPSVYEYSLYNAKQGNYSGAIYSLKSIMDYHPLLLDFDKKAFQCYLKKNYKTAVLYYLLLSEFDIPSALSNALFILENIRPFNSTDSLLFSIYNDKSKDIKFFHNKVGNCYYYGRGVERSYENALAHYIEGGKLTGEGAYNLANMYIQGLGVVKNFQMALNIIRKHKFADYEYLLPIISSANILISSFFDVWYFNIVFISFTIFFIFASHYGILN